MVAGAKRFKSPCAVRDSVGSTGEMPPVLAGLDFATPSLNALKDALPTLSFDEELSDATGQGKLQEGQDLPEASNLSIL